MIRTNFGKITLTLAIIFVVIVSGCKKEEVSDVTDIDRMQGTWKGTELGDRGGEWAFVFTGDQVEVDGPGPQDYSGSIAIDETTTPSSARFTISKCAFEQYVGTTANNIYKFEGDKLVLAGTEPGSESKPISFQTGNGTRIFELTKVEVQ